MRNYKRSSTNEPDGETSPFPTSSETSLKPTLRKLNEENWQEIKADYEEAILSGLTKDEAASFALINDQDHDKLLVKEVEDNPNWLNDLITIGRSNLKATARVHAARKVRAGEGSFVLPVAQATSPDLSPKAIAIKVDLTDTLPEEERTKLLSKFPSAIDTTATSNDNHTD